MQHVWRRVGRVCSSRVFFFKKNQFPFTLVSWNAFVFVCVDISWSGLPVAECLSDAVSESYAALSY
jgi:hypothetical protein